VCVLAECFVRICLRGESEYRLPEADLAAEDEESLLAVATHLLCKEVQAGRDISCTNRLRLQGHGKTKEQSMARSDYVPTNARHNASVAARW
jgi:hypothetical protein